MKYLFGVFAALGCTSVAYCANQQIENQNGVDSAVLNAGADSLAANLAQPPADFNWIENFKNTMANDKISVVFKSDLFLNEVSSFLESQKTILTNEEFRGVAGQLLQIKDKIKEATAQYKIEIEKYEETDKKQKEIKVQIATQDQENQALQAEIDKLTQDIKTKTSDIDSIKSKIAEVEEKIKAQTKEIEAKKIEEENLNAQLEKLQNETNAKIAENNKEVQKKQAELASVTENLKKVTEAKDQAIKHIQDALSAKTDLLSLSIQLPEFAAKLKESKQNADKLAADFEKTMKAMQGYMSKPPIDPTQIVKYNGKDYYNYVNSSGKMTTVQQNALKEFENLRESVKQFNDAQTALEKLNAEIKIKTEVLDKAIQETKKAATV